MFGPWHAHEMAAAASAGYSGTPLPRKLGIKAGEKLALLRAPENFRETLGDLPDGVSVSTRTGRDMDVVVAFFKRRAELEERLPKLMDAWMSTAASGSPGPSAPQASTTDITEDTLREVGLPLGLVDNKVCAIDETWSGLRLVYRKENRDAVRAARSRRMKPE